jgi:ABC-type sugar transport system substrate-binding protein
MQSKLAIFCSLIVVALLLPTGTAQAEEGKPHVLVIQSYHKEYPWDATYLEGIRKTLAAHATITTFEMDTKRLPKETFPERARLAFEAYQASKPDLVIVGDDNATKMLAAQISEAGTPVIFLGVNANPRAYDLVGKDLVGGYSAADWHVSTRVLPWIWSTMVCELRRPLHNRRAWDCGAYMPRHSRRNRGSCIVLSNNGCSRTCSLR